MGGVRSIRVLYFWNCFNFAKPLTTFRYVIGQCSKLDRRSDVSRTSTVLLTVGDRVRTSMVLVLLRCVVVVEQHAKTAF